MRGKTRATRGTAHLPAWLVCAGVAFGQVAWLSGQTPTFRTTVSYVSVDVVVTDRHGRSVRGLDASDFVVTEAGQPQTIDAVVESQPRDTTNDVLRVPVTDGVSSLATNDRDAAGQVFLVVLDTFHVTASDTPLLRTRAKAFVDHYIHPTDRVGVAHIGYPRLNQDFTYERDLVEKSIDAFIGQKVPPAIIATVSGTPDLQSRQRQLNLDETEYQLSQLCKILSVVPKERKTLVFFSEGPDVPIGPQSLAFLSYQEALATAAKNNVVIYAVDPRGIADPMQDDIQISGIAESGGAGPGLELVGAWRNAQQFLRNIAEETGGFALVGTNALADGFDRIAAESSSYYVLRYYSTRTAKADELRRILVAVTRPGLQVRARQSAMVVAPTKIETGRVDTLGRAIFGPVSQGGWPIRMMATALVGVKAARLHLVADLEPPSFRGPRPQVAGERELKIQYQAISATGAVVASRLQTLTFHPVKEVSSPDGPIHLRYTTECDLEPGRYQIRLAVLDESSGEVATVYGDVDVPDFHQSPVTLSGLLLSVPTTGHWLVADGGDSLQQRLRWPPTLSREFDRSTPLLVFAQAAIRGQGEITCIVTTSIRSDAGALVYQRNADLRSSTLGRSGGVVAEVPLSQLPPGTYRLELEVKTSSDPIASARRQIEFSLR